MRDPRAGFTLVELLVIVIVISVLAAIGIPRLSSTKGRAYAASLRSDLRNLATAEESYYATNHTYSSDISALEMHPSPGVQISFGAVDGQGWGAAATHAAAHPVVCALFEGGSRYLVAPAQAEGTVACTDEGH